LETPVHAGMSVADAIQDPTASAQTRRAALAVARRVAVWRAAAGIFADHGTEAATSVAAGHDPVAAARGPSDMARLLAALERFEATTAADDAAIVKQCIRFDHGDAVRRVASRCAAPSPITILQPNVRVAVASAVPRAASPRAADEEQGLSKRRSPAGRSAVHAR